MPSPSPLPSGTVTFMFSDIVGSTDIGQKMPGATSDERQRAYGEKIKHPQAAIVREQAAARSGSFVSDTGDGFLFAFDDAEKAVLCGVEIQRRIVAARIETPNGILQLRIGFHTGYAVPENGNYTATAINKAARVQSAAEPGTVFLSKETRAAVDGKIHGITTRSAGSFDLKGIGNEELFIAEDIAPSSRTPDVVRPSSSDHPRSSIPHNLPTLQPFFGREDELKKIADALDPDSRTWGALIDGPGGMGKTSLAVRAAYDASPDAFKKILFISLKTRELDDDGERYLGVFILSGLVELLNELARELGCADIAKAPEDQRPRLLLEALRGTQTLLVLDNLESLVKRERDTLFTFVKKLPAGCKAILTSRGRIGSGAEELILEKLSEEARSPPSPNSPRTIGSSRRPAKPSASSSTARPPARSRSCSAGPPASSGAATASPSPMPCTSSAPARRGTTRSNLSSAISWRISARRRAKSSARSPTSPWRRRWSTSPPSRVRSAGLRPGVSASLMTTPGRRPALRRKLLSIWRASKPPYAVS